MRIWHDLYSESITLENIFQAWGEFVKGKRNKRDVQVFDRHLEDNLFNLYEELENKSYKHGKYKSFFVRDPKSRHIHKSCVRDRVVHHLVSKILEKIFDPAFYTHSYSCRKRKGTHKAVYAFVNETRRMSNNNTSPLFVLKCDIKKFFACVDHEVLIDLIKRRINDQNFLWLLTEIVESFRSEFTEHTDSPKGMPIGNLTSQIFANIYMDPFDQFIKHKLKIKYYIRYTDDFVILSKNKDQLKQLIPKIEDFLKENLKMSLHPKKIIIRDYYLGIDFLGYVVFPHFVLPRTKTKKRIFRKLSERGKMTHKGWNPPEALNQTLQSYLGYLSHCNAFEMSLKIKALASFNPLF